MGDKSDSSLSSGSKRTNNVITEATEQMDETPSWLWEQLETDGATLDSVMSKIDSLTKAQLQKYFPQEEWGNLAGMTTEERRKAIEDKLKEMGIGANWRGKGPFNPKGGQVDVKNFNPFKTVTEGGKPRKDGSTDYSKGFSNLDRTLDKMSIDELKQVIKQRRWGNIPKNANHRFLKNIIRSRVETRVSQGEEFYSSTR